MVLPSGTEDRTPRHTPGEFVFKSLVHEMISQYFAALRNPNPNPIFPDASSKRKREEPPTNEDSCQQKKAKLQSKEEKPEISRDKKTPASTRRTKKDPWISLQDLKECRQLAVTPHGRIPFPRVRGISAVVSAKTPGIYEVDIKRSNRASIQIKLFKSMTCDGDPSLESSASFLRVRYPTPAIPTVGPGPSAALIQAQPTGVGEVAVDPKHLVCAKDQQHAELRAGCQLPALPAPTESWLTLSLLPAEIRKEYTREWWDRVWALPPKDKKNHGMMFGNEVTFQRIQQTYDIPYAFTGSDAISVLPLPEEWKATSAYIDSLDHKQNGGLENRYKNGQDYIGLHSDSEKGIVPYSNIFSLTILEPHRSTASLLRTFLVAGIKGLYLEGFELEIDLCQGLCMIMQGGHQLYTKHGMLKIPKTRLSHYDYGRLNFTKRQMMVAEARKPPRSPKKREEGE